MGGRRALGECLRAVVPASVSVQTRQGMIIVDGTGIDVALRVGWAEGTEDALLGVADDLLERASEAVSESTGDPWPARAGQFPDAFPPHTASIAGGELRMSYGDPAAPILTLGPIPVADVLRRSG